MTEILGSLFPLSYYLKQRDPRWANLKLGFSNVTIGGYGCAITALAMLLNYRSAFVTFWNPPKVNSELVRAKAYRDTNLVDWQRIPEVFPDAHLIYSGRIDTPKTPAPIDRIDALLRAGMPVIVKVDSDLGKPDVQEHFVLVHGKVGANYTIADPYKNAATLCPAYGATPAIAVVAMILYSAELNT